MKKRLMITCFLGAISVGVNAQTYTRMMYNYENFPALSSTPISTLLKSPVVIQNSTAAVHTRTANCDFAADTTLIGIVWCDQNGNAEVSFSGFKVGTVLGAYSNQNELSGPPSSQIDPGYQIGFPDISVQKESPSSNEIIATVVYQRRLNITDPWEVAYKRYYISDFTTFNPYFETQPTSLGTGKVPAIDAILETDKMSSIPLLTSQKNAIAFSNGNGYELRIIANNDVVLEARNIPVNIVAQFPDYDFSDQVKFIDLAAVCRTGRHASGATANDVVHMIYLEETGTPGSTASYVVASWEDIDYDILTTEAVHIKNTLPQGVPQAERCKIEAMAIQDYYTTDNHFVALMEVDFSGLGNIIGHNSPSGHTATYAGYLPLDGVDLNNDPNCSVTHFPLMGFDLSAGVGLTGDQAFYTNRHHSITREATYVNISNATDLYLFRFGIEREQPSISHFQGNQTFPNTLPTVNFDVYATDNIAKDAYVSPQLAGDLTSLHYLREGYWLENVSSSASLNTGKFLVKTWIDVNNGVQFKCFDAREDISLTALTSQWKTPSATPTTALYPNPVQDVLSIENREDVIAAYSIYAIDGKLILSEANINAIAHPIDVKRLTTGTYMIKTQHQSGATHNYKFIKQ